MRKPSKPTKGSILVTILLVASVLALLVAAVTTDSLQTLKSVSQSGRDAQARFGAYAGLEMVMNELRQNPVYIGSPIADRHGKMTRSLTELEDIEFEVLIWNNAKEEGQSSPGPLTGPDGLQVQPDTVYMVASGTDKTAGQQVVLASMAGTARRIRPVFTDAAYARSKMMIAGDSRVDAWDSEGGHHSYKGGSSDDDDDDGPGGGHGHKNVRDYQASLGTDSILGRTLRLLDDSQINGHFRLGPSTTESRAFGSDGGSSTMDEEGGSSTTYAVATAEKQENVKGVEGDTSKKAVVDDETTEVPRFRSPFSDTDVGDAFSPNNQWTTSEGKGGSVQHHPPAPESLSPGAYSSVDVGKDQTLYLSPGVYYFDKGFNVNEGTVKLHGGGPVIIFCGEQANFNKANINIEQGHQDTYNGNTTRLQLCFTDEITDPEEILAVAETLTSAFDGLSAAQIAARLSMGAQEFDPETGDPLMYPGSTTTTASTAEGISRLTMNETNFSGSISGKNLIADIRGSEVYGAIMGNVVMGQNFKLHQDLALKGSSLMQSSGWALQGVHKIR